MTIGVERTDFARRTNWLVEGNVSKRRVEWRLGMVHVL